MTEIEAQAVEPYVPNQRLRRAVLCDIDGTLAERVDRHPFDFARCEEDTVNWPVFEELDLRYSAGFDIILMSGRPTDFREHTLRWLEKHLVPFTELHMRGSGDYRPDNVVKYELFNAHVRERFNVGLALDDRDRVVKLWRDMGIPTWQVNYGNF